MWYFYPNFQPVVDGYRNKCEFTIAEGPDGGMLYLQDAYVVTY